jgi:glycosyltransferase involved in cell wall biosynthesis
MSKRDPFAQPASQVSLAVVVPAFNEASTVYTTVETMLNTVKSFPTVSELRVIIVESNSTDGTREEVLRLQETYGVRVILQNEPRGKGFAVREGLVAALESDVCVIYDADDEYSPSDLESLLEPIIGGKTSFVLGSRHRKREQMRRFDDAPLTAFVMNMAHWAFTGLFNAFYGTRLTDPFTMYKVFRTDAVRGLKFSANRFDFDWELVAKLVRNGAVPVELPVTYVSRHFSEGKKVRFIRDPLSWLVALVKYRFQPLR